MWAENSVSRKLVHLVCPLIIQFVPFQVLNRTFSGHGAVDTVIGSLGLVFTGHAKSIHVPMNYFFGTHGGVRKTPLAGLQLTHVIDYIRSDCPEVSQVRPQVLSSKRMSAELNEAMLNIGVVAECYI